MNKWLVISIVFTMIMAILKLLVDSEVEAKIAERAYKPRNLLTKNEKSAFVLLKEITDKHNLYLFTKVRLFDLVDTKTSKDWRKHQNKIKSKHVDFVICDEYLNAKWVIELDDSTHDREDRIARDKFVDTVLNSCNYKILHIRHIDSKEIEAFINTI